MGRVLFIIQKLRKNIKIKLKEFLRQEIKFENLEQLKEQISLDIEKAHQYFRENE